MEATLRALHTARTKAAAMVPRYAQLHPGTPVNIVLKADQRTGKITTGHVADILTRGDHPRGVKVRLSEGQIGRVQSLVTGQMTQSSQMPAAAVGLDGNDELAFARGSAASASEPAQGIWSTRTLGSGSGASGMRGGRIQGDVRNDPVPVEERSLVDYIKKPSKNKQKKGRGKGGLKLAEGELAGQGVDTAEAKDDVKASKSMQEQLQDEFPELDTALIAAILADHGGGEGARTVLRGLK